MVVRILKLSLEYRKKRNVMDGNACHDGTKGSDDMCHSGSSMCGFHAVSSVAKYTQENAGK